MTRESLKEASDELRAAMEIIEDEEKRERIYEQSDQLAELATRDQEPDHGRLDRHMNTLYELANEFDGVNDEAASKLRDARDSVTEFRKTVEGV